MANYYPQQQGYPPQQQGWQQQGPPQQFGGYPPQGQQQWGAPQNFQQQPQHGHRLSQGFAQPPGPPTMHGGIPPPPQGFQAPPGPPPQQGGFPPQQQFGQQQQYPQQAYTGIGQASPGYTPNQAAQGDARNDVQALQNAISGFRRDHSIVIRILTKPDPLQIALLNQTYSRERGGTNLADKIGKDFSGHYGETLVACARGPLLNDVHNVRDSIKGLGTKEAMMNDVLVGRSNADMRAIKAIYPSVHQGKTLESDVGSDLSLKTKDMFDLIMRATRNEENAPVMPQEIANDCHRLHTAMSGISKDQTTVYSILLQRSDGQLRAITQEFKRQYQGSLEERVKSKFSGHMEEVLLLALARANDRAKSDADLLEDSMKGLGTKDTLLIQRVVRLHWDRQHMDQVKRAYKHFYKRELTERVKGEISSLTDGHYREAVLSCLT